MIKTILGKLLGAGSGLLGTWIRTALAFAAGILVSKGYITADTAASLTDTFVAAGLALLAAIGSYLNNEVQLNKEPPAK